jgi:hypothetical protein
MKTISRLKGTLEKSATMKPSDGLKTCMDSLLNKTVVFFRLQVLIPDNNI